MMKLPITTEEILDEFCDEDDRFYINSVEFSREQIVALINITCMTGGCEWRKSTDEEIYTVRRIRDHQGFIILDIDNHESITAGIDMPGDTISQYKLYISIE